jgi:long-chain acyl-CoA synthetase
VDGSSPLTAATLTGLFEARAKRSGAETAYRQFDRTSESWRDIRWSEMHDRVLLWRTALRRDGMRTGDRVAVRLRNSVEWVCFDQAALALGLVVVPLFVRDAVATVRHVLRDSGARLLLVDDASAWSAIRGQGEQELSMERVVCVERAEKAIDGRIRSLGEWLPQAAEEVAGMPRITPDTLATIVYTSGTTGQPKGVMLTHRNLLAVAEAVLERNPGRATDRFLSYLPLAHIFERVLGYYIPIMIGAQVQFARSAAELPSDLAAARPTVLLLVPSVLERLRSQVEEKAGRAPGGRWLLSWTVVCGLKVFEARRKRHPVGATTRFAWALLRRLVANKIVAALGGRVRLAVSGGAALPPETARFFLGLGLPLVEGYGLTEASSAVAGARLGDYVPGSAGPPLKGVVVRIREDGHILVRSPGVMRGYWGQEKATHEALADGWLDTGDIGEMQEGNLRVVRRAGDILVLSTGEKLDASSMEAAIGRDRLFAQVLVTGHDRPHPAALLVLDETRWRRLAAELGVPADDPAALGNPAVTAELCRRLEHLLTDFPSFARIRAMHLTLHPWTVDEGLLTPTLKPKRGAIEKRFALDLEALETDASACGLRPVGR